jgi:hypothetical protein
MSELVFGITWTGLLILIVIACYKQLREHIRLHDEMRKFESQRQVIGARFEAAIMQLEDATQSAVIDGSLTKRRAWNWRKKIGIRRCSRGEVSYIPRIERDENG